MVVTVCEFCGKDFGSGAGRASHIRARAANGLCGDSRQLKIKSSRAASTASTAAQPPTPTYLTPTSRAGAEWSVGATLKRRSAGDVGPDGVSEDRSPGLLRKRIKPTRVYGLQEETPEERAERLGLERQRQADDFQEDFASPILPNPSAKLVEDTEYDIRDVPVGEEGMWVIEPETGKRKISSRTGRPMLDRKGRDYFVHYANMYEPWKLEVPKGEEGMWSINPATGKRNLSTISGLPMLDWKSRDYVVHFAMKYEPWKLDQYGKLL
ncbi:hypothetical protein CB0940_06553 [Cercospora beticola]|uniref:Uncharacterized protein n=1 Tax=Cercospora beticola TaxID=122368 RepID=A0A2G5HXQ2_CERBT|nr:hypothetical protein CB0940_06553 [Cercospora beticola]PIA97344.1 hypothetical protein CB0940_06553 [Cercospora beticola]WPA99195.1 hypothetical protein RHO25_003811 [Cercospora beticola]